MPAPDAVHRSLADLGGFFTLEVGDDALRSSGLVPLAHELRPDAVERRLSTLRERLAAFGQMPTEDLDPKVAASALQVGLVSRLWSITLAAVCLHDAAPRLLVEDLWCSPAAPSPVPMGVQSLLLSPLTSTDGVETAGAGTADAGLARAVAERVLPTVLAIGDAARAVVPVGEQVLRSNAASSLVAAAGVLTRARPEVGDRAHAVVTALAALPWLATGATGWDDPTGPGFRRRGCCLYYRVPGHGLCGDCVLERQPAG